MQTNKQCNVAISRTINMGNYNSLKVTAGLGASIADTDDTTSTYKELWNTVNAEIERALKAFKTK